MPSYNDYNINTICRGELILLTSRGHSVSYILKKLQLIASKWTLFIIPQKTLSKIANNSPPDRSTDLQLESRLIESKT